MKKEKKYIILAAAVVLCLLVGVGIGIIIGRNSTQKEGKEEQTELSSDYDALECISLPEYKEMDVSIAVSQEDIDQEIESLREDYTTYEQKKGVVEQDDQVYAEFEGYIDGKRVDDVCGSDYVQIGSDEWLEDFSNNLVGMKTGSEKKFSVQVPDGTYGDETVDGHTVEYHVTVEYICGKEIVPEYNNDFVKSISSDCKTTKQYNKYLKEKLLEENRESRGESAWSAILEDCTVKKYPENLLKEAEEEVIQGYYDMAEMYNESVEQIFVEFGYESEKEFRETELEELSKDTVKEYLLIEALAKSEGISYSDADYDTIVEEEYEYNSEQYDDKEQYEEACRTALKREALRQAVIEWLAQNMKYTEK